MWQDVFGAQELDRNRTSGVIGSREREVNECCSEKVHAILVRAMAGMMTSGASGSQNHRNDAGMDLLPRSRGGECRARTGWQMRDKQT